VGKSVQLAALNADPLEARLLRQQLMVLERIAAAVERRREADASGRVHDPVSAAGTFAISALASSPLAAGLGALLGGRR
jgi:23S rRNA G2445 N2-methylase RlmL